MTRKSNKYFNSLSNALPNNRLTVAGIAAAGGVAGGISYIAVRSHYLAENTVANGLELRSMLDAYKKAVPDSDEQTYYQNRVLELETPHSLTRQQEFIASGTAMSVTTGIFALYFAGKAFKRYVSNAKTVTKHQTSGNDNHFKDYERPATGQDFFGPV